MGLLELLEMRCHFFRKETLCVKIRVPVCLLLLAANTVSTDVNCPPCHDDDKGTLKSTCQEQGVYLADSESSNNSTIVCSALHELFICIAQHIPQCLEKVGSVSDYGRYTMDPWNCSMDRYIKQYQEIVHEGCKTTTVYAPVKSGDRSQYKMVNDGENQNTTSAGIAHHRYGCWNGLAVSMSLGLIFQFSDFGYLKL